MSEDLIRYDILVQDALRGAMRKVLSEVARTGLPGEHHFYIAVDTTSPGVRISSRLRERYPKEMTIVLQHQFWDLVILEHTFEVGLSFGGVPERLLVPFSAVKGFFDPSVQFALEFEPGKTAEELPQDIVEAGDMAQLDRIQVELDAEEGDSVTTQLLKETDGDLESDNDKIATIEPEAVTEADTETADEPEDADVDSEDEQDEAEPGGAQVVSLDAFRKKN